MFRPFGGGGGKGSDKPSKAIEEATSTSSTTSSASSSSSDKGSVHGFDPSALERAAKAARELDGSQNAPRALEIIREQERTKQKEMEARRAEYMAHQEQLAMRRISMEQEAAQRTLESQTEHDKTRAHYRDDLERKRIADQINAQRALQEEERKKAEESVLRQEAIRRKTLEYEAELRQQTELARVKAETEGRTRQERENFDLYLKKSRQEGEMFRETVMDGIKLAGTTIGTGVMELLKDTERMRNAGLAITGIAFGIYTARTATGVVGRYIESTLGKPNLVRETSRRSPLQAIRRPIHTLQSSVRRYFAKEENALQNVVLEPTLFGKLTRIAVSTANTRKNRAPYRNLLLYGPPGTGKTMFAKGLAHNSGLHFAIMTGGDVAPLGREAVTEIHKLFDWANSSSKGLLLFVDEADAFLRKRSTGDMSEDVRNALNAFLYRTGEPSSRIMCVFASNQPDQFDYAINDRIDDFVEFNLPGLDERKKMLAQYLQQYIISSPSQAKTITVEANIDEAFLTRVAEKIDGFSGREIAKLTISWQAAAYGLSSAALTQSLMEEVLEDHIKQKARKTSWNDQMAWHSLTVDGKR